MLALEQFGHNQPHLPVTGHAGNSPERSHWLPRWRRYHNTRRSGYSLRHVYFGNRILLLGEQHIEEDIELIGIQLPRPGC